MRKGLLRVFCAAAALAAVVAGGARAEDKVVRIGAIQSMTGVYAAYGQEGQPVVDYYVRKINEAGGIKSMGGARIELILADDGSDPARTAAEARRLITQEKVSLLMGTILSGQMIALSPVLDELKVPAMALQAAGSRSPYLFAMGFPYDRGYAKTMADFAGFLAREKGFDLKTVALLYSDFEAGQQVNKFLKDRLIAQGFKVVDEIPLASSAPDHLGAVARLRSVKPDFTAGLLTPRDGQLLLRARHDLNYHDSLFIGGTAGFADMSLWRELGPDTAGKVLTTSLFAMTGFSLNASAPAVQAAVKEIRDAGILKGEVGQGAMQAAQAVRIIQQVLEKAGSTDPDRILAAFRAVEFPSGDPNLLMLKANGLAFDDDRLAKDGSAVMVQWTEDRRQEVVFPKAFAMSEPRRWRK